MASVGGRMGRPLLTLILLGAAGCGGDTAVTVADGPTFFIAFASSFEGFRSWVSFHGDGPAPGSFPADVLGPRTQYINKVPRRGSSTFPVGTMIVEVRENESHTIFAGVKRGGGFNPTGALGWEWFELQETSVSGTVVVVWRGVGPTDGAAYGGDPLGGCNRCHRTFAGNDYVASPFLQLASF